MYFFNEELYYITTMSNLLKKMRMTEVGNEGFQNVITLSKMLK